MTQAERTRTIKYVLAEQQMAAAQTKEQDEDKHTDIPGCREKNKKRKKRKTKSRKQGTKASKQENRTQGVSIATNLRVSATKPRRRRCHTICHLLPAVVGNYQVSLLPLSSHPPENKSTKTKQNCLDSGAVATQVPLISRTGTLSHDQPFHFCIL